MKKTHFTDSQILAILKQAESDVPIPDLCREHGMGNLLSDNYGGMDASSMTRMQELAGFARMLFSVSASGQRLMPYRIYKFPIL